LQRRIRRRFSCSLAFEVGAGHVVEEDRAGGDFGGEGAFDALLVGLEPFEGVVEVVFVKAVQAGRFGDCVVLGPASRRKPAALAGEARVRCTTRVFAGACFAGRPRGRFSDSRTPSTNRTEL